MPLSIEIPACETTLSLLPERIRPSSGLHHTCATSRASHGQPCKSPLRTQPISPRCVTASPSKLAGSGMLWWTRDQTRAQGASDLAAGRTNQGAHGNPVRSDDFISLIAEEPSCTRDWIAVSDLRGTDPSIVSSNIGKCRTGTWKARSGTAASLVLGQSYHRSRGGLKGKNLCMLLMRK